MGYPMLEINSSKIKENTKLIVDECHKRGIQVAGVTKVFAGYERIVRAIVDGGIDIIADSRIENLKKFKKYDLPKMLIRIPMKSQAREIINYSDIALVSEFDTIKELQKYAKKENKKYKIILMVDVGDLREGIFYKEKQEIYETVKKILELSNIELHGIGTNLCCYGGVIPTKDNLTELVGVKKDLENYFNIRIPIISGGNSENIQIMRMNEMPMEINQLRIGVALAMGIGLYDKPIEGLNTDTIKLYAEIVEIKVKPSVPIGTIGIDAFGAKPQFEDRGFRKRAICALGRQDVYPEFLQPIDEKIKVLGSSSDHLIIDITDSDKELRIGDVIEFRVLYGGLLSAMTSKYVKKKVL
ncbi:MULTISPECIES: ornithine racemase Orr [Caloramator]|uniref:Putative cytoplasmic protein n=1 Tax=Caloramator australicus RC3 TaxID=857293 RepID=I7K765_9CLOT|nr:MULTISPECIES: ornithine racemase Orr [Caloramator]MDO6354419.1 ornithine racemase Orr [Caloramator sp. CAR-1]CCJ33349.1 Putative cytoplasmic protein [Caloramator australicus RC3]